MGGNYVKKRNIWFQCIISVILLAMCVNYTEVFAMTDESCIEQAEGEGNILFEEETIFQTESPPIDESVNL